MKRSERTGGGAETEIDTVAQGSRDSQTAQPQRRGNCIRDGTLIGPRFPKKKKKIILAHGSERQCSVRVRLEDKLFFILQKQSIARNLTNKERV